MRNWDKTPKERRKHPRFPIVRDLIEPIDLAYSPGEKTGIKKQPALLTNLSAGGMSLLTFTEPPHVRKFLIDLDLPGLSHIPIEAKIARVQAKEQVFNLGLVFTKVNSKDRRRINGLAEDYNNCETRISLNLPEVCIPKCAYYLLCTKRQKSRHGPPKV